MSSTENKTQPIPLLVPQEAGQQQSATFTMIRLFLLRYQTQFQKCTRQSKQQTGFSTNETHQNHISVSWYRALQSEEP